MSLLDEFKHSLHICMAWQQAANVFLPCESFKCCYPSISRNESHSQTGHGVRASEHLHSSNPAFDLCESVWPFTGMERYKLRAIVTWKDSTGKPEKNKSKGTPAQHRASRSSLVSGHCKNFTEQWRKTRLAFEYYFSWKTLFSYINVCANYYNNPEFIPVTNQL